MRILSLSALALLCAAPVRAQDDGGSGAKVNDEVVKLVRAVLDAKKDEDREEYRKQVLAHPGLDWPSVRKGLELGCYFQKPMVTGYGERHSGKHFDIRYTSADNKPRGFSMWVPKSYEADKPVPVLLYLHHDPHHPNIQMGSEKAGVALLKFRDLCEKHGFLLVAPYTSQGAEWWTPGGKGLVEWTLREVRRRYNIDDDRIALMGALGGADAVWYLGQEMPGTWSCLMPMTGDPYEIGAMIRPLYLGTLDRMDVLMGVPGVVRSTVGEKNTNRFLDGLAPMFGQRMRITAAVYPTAQGDFAYLEEVKPAVAAFVMEQKRKPYADEVDIETDNADGLRSLWLRNDGYDGAGQTPHGFDSTELKWTAPKRDEYRKVLGLDLRERGDWAVGMLVAGASGEAARARIFPGDVLLEVAGQAVRNAGDVRPLVEKHEWEDEVRLLLAREIKESRRKDAERAENHYRKVRAKIAELKAQGLPIPDDIGASVEEDEPAVEEEEEEEDEGDGDGGFEISDDSAPKKDDKGDGGAGAGKGEREKTFWLVFERWVRIRKPAGPLVRSDFGASRDTAHDKEGVKVGGVYAGSLADRSGLKAGDIIVAVGDTHVKTAHDIEAWFDGFKFEDEPDDGNWVSFTIKRQEGQDNWVEKTVTVRWTKPVSSRVDARWNKRENTLYVLARKASGFTLYFNEDLIEPGKSFHMFINGQPWRDLVEPESAPEYPELGHGSDNVAADRHWRMQRERAKIDGWTPDLAWALDEALTHRDRRLVFGAKRSFDLKTMHDGFNKMRGRLERREAKRGERVQQAYEAWKSQG